MVAACKPSEQQVAQDVERKRIECLDKVCEGDVKPSLDGSKESAIKLNGRWYIGPKEYFNGYDGRTGFEWWEHKPISASMTRPQALQALVVDGKGYDVAIEIFLGTAKEPSPSMYRQLQEARRTASVLETKTLRPGLEMWRTQEKDRLPETWYVATNLREPGGDAPTLACRGSDPTQYRCTTGFIWRPGVGANLRFRATHGTDWPEIYLETDRVLNLLRKA